MQTKHPLAGLWVLKYTIDPSKIVGSVNFENVKLAIKIADTGKLEAIDMEGKLTLTSKGASPPSSNSKYFYNVAGDWWPDYIAINRERNRERDRAKGLPLDPDQGVEEFGLRANLQGSPGNPYSSHVEITGGFNERWMLEPWMLTSEWEKLDEDTMDYIRSWNRFLIEFSVIVEKNGKPVAHVNYDDFYVVRS